MKKFFLILLCLILLTGCGTKKNVESKNGLDNSESMESEKMDGIVKNKYVSYNGKLSLDGVDLVNQYGEKIQLKGVSSHGLHWYGDFVSEQNIKILKEDWGSNVFRLAMYTAEGGYLTNKSLYNDVVNKIDMIIKMDLYVIIDWHILYDNNPLINVDEAKDFFSKISKKYANVPNIIYEICNEPNGNVNWNQHIKPYADQVIQEIRKNSKQSIIIVGTGTWSQDILDPIDNPVNDEYVMYAVHFYSGTHTGWLRDRVKKARESNIPVFISEWGTSDASGNNGIYLEEAQKWIDYMKEENISWVNWSLCDKGETSAILKSGAGANGLNDQNLTDSGKFVKKAMKD